MLVRTCVLPAQIYDATWDTSGSVKSWQKFLPKFQSFTLEHLLKEEERINTWWASSEYQSHWILSNPLFQTHHYKKLQVLHYKNLPFQVCCCPSSTTWQIWTRCHAELWYLFKCPLKRYTRPVPHPLPNPQPGWEQPELQSSEHPGYLNTKFPWSELIQRVLFGDKLFPFPRVAEDTGRWNDWIRIKRNFSRVKHC